MVKSPAARKTPALIELAAAYASALAVIFLFKGVGAGVPSIKRELPFIAAAVFMTIPLIMIKLRGQSLSDYGMRTRAPVYELTFALVAMLAVFPLFGTGYHIWQKFFLQHPPVFRLPANLPYLIAAHFLLVALPEEFFYRGYMQGTLKRIFPGGARIAGATVGPAILITSALFALGHFLLDPRPMRLGVFFPSLLFGWMKERTGSITAPVIFHAMSNILMVILERSYLG
ncbi:MAG: JDVT-CTERM system glutamic-type intramembrane protease [Myxococcota bacterium]|jgi:hypothetical protein